MTKLLKYDNNSIEKENKNKKMNDIQLLIQKAVIEGNIEFLENFKKDNPDHDFTLIKILNDTKDEGLIETEEVVLNSFEVAVESDKWTSLDWLIANSQNKITDIAMITVQKNNKKLFKKIAQKLESREFVELSFKLTANSMVHYLKILTTESAKINFELESKILFFGIILKQDNVIENFQPFKLYDDQKSCKIIQNLFDFVISNFSKKLNFEYILDILSKIQFSSDNELAINYKSDLISYFLDNIIEKMNHDDFKEFIVTSNKILNYVFSSDSFYHRFSDILVFDEDNSNIYTNNLFRNIKYIFENNLFDIRYLSIPNMLGYTPLTYAVLKQNHIMIDLILSTGFNINIPDEQGRTALIVAAQNLDKDLAQKLVSLGADPELALNGYNASGAALLSIAKLLEFSLMPEDDFPAYVESHLEILAYLIQLGGLEFDILEDSNDDFDEEEGDIFLDHKIDVIIHRLKILYPDINFEEEQEDQHQVLDQQYQSEIPISMPSLLSGETDEFSDIE